ncbi:MAG: hypothetical protein ACRD20_08290 [Terriglobales bacterium]
MTEIVYQAENRPSMQSSLDWSAVWAGLFTFIAIWSVFGFLGFALFSSAANSSIGQSANAMNIGLGIWAIVLTAIAMYIAGLETGRLARLDGRFERGMHGMIMFGLSVAAAVVLTISGGMLFTGLPATGVSIQHPYILNAFGGSVWTTFIALFLGWLSAITGASASGKPKYVVPSNVQDVREMRPAA